MARPNKYYPELRERAVRMVFEHAHDHPLAVGDGSVRAGTMMNNMGALINGRAHELRDDGYFGNTPRSPDGVRHKGALGASTR